MRRTLLIACALLGGVLLLGGCDTGGGPATLDTVPPVVSDLAYSPDAVDLEAVPPEQISGDVLNMTLSMSAQVVDSDGDLEGVTYVVLPPDRNAEPLAEGTLTASEGDRYTGTADLAIPLGQIGLFTVRIYAYDAAGQLSNEVRGALRITGAGAPPVIESVSPDTIQRPATGTREVQIVATVSDSDGLPNIIRVLFWNIEQPGTRFQLFDDGSSGDQQAGDGRYTITVEVVADNAPGTNTFAFQAYDRFGLESEIFEKDIVIE